MTTPPVPKPKAARPPSSLQIMFAAILAIALILAINFASRITGAQPLQQTYDEVSAELDQLRQEQAALIAERDYVRSDAYVEEWARDEGKLVRPGESLYIPVPVVGAQVAQETETTFVPIETSPPQPPPWVIWWQLFFDTPPPEF